MTLSSSFFLDQLTGAGILDTDGKIWIAYSGGLDSRVLLQLAVAAGLHDSGRLNAVHIHHGLQASADHWALHCAEVCAELGVPLAVHRVAVTAGASLENQARMARYQVFESLLAEADWLLQGHHANDQAETLLLRLMRGSGVRGLAAIPWQRSLGLGRLFRPLLACTRKQLHSYAEQLQLSWIDDPSNEDARFDRNYLRAEVLPALEQRWPGAVDSLGLSARHSADALQLCEELAQLDLSGCQQDRGLSIEVLSRLAVHRRHNLLRFWLQRLAGVSADEALLERLWSEVAHARQDAQPQLQLGVISVRRYEGRLFLLPPQPDIDVGQCWRWSLRTDAVTELRLPGGLLRATPCQGAGLALPAAGALEICWRRGGERIQLPGQSIHRSVKKLLQQHQLAPWLRSRLPLIYADGQLLAVADLWFSAEAKAVPGEPGVALSWQPDALPLAADF